MYIPELIFGHLLTGSNFDDDEERLTGGRHGYGAKLTNIFSKSFTVETVDSSQNLKYRQTWLNNMTEPQPPVIVPIDSTSQLDYTSVAFVPDLPKLTGIPNSTTLSDEDYSIMCRRVIDVAGCSNGKLQVSLNGSIVNVTSFEDYCQLYRNPESPPLLYNSSDSSQWSLAVGVSEHGSFESSTFVNNVATSRGGSHVNILIQQITKHIMDDFKKRKHVIAGLLTPTLIRRTMFLICHAEVVNPSFDSQMKEFLTTSPNHLSSASILSNSFLNNLLIDKENGGPGILEEILRCAKDQQQASLMKDINEKKSKRQLSSIPKLEDAHRAGTNESPTCTLILTEGDSAKALAIAGLEVIGRERYGVFPLRGKLLNVRQASASQIVNNAEIKSLCAILGLSFNKTYETKLERNELRYGHVMIMTDQDPGM
jgi:DNA topoisomerase II